MTRDSIDYGQMMHHAMRGLMHDVLTRIAQDGLPGDHHFYITFDTMHPDVEIADWLSDRFPEEMTVVLQHWFDGLQVDGDGFAVTLNFGNAPEPLYIPWDSVKTFVDPSVEFGLRFDSQESDEDTSEEEAPFVEVEPDDEPEQQDAEIVSLDKFRK